MTDPQQQQQLIAPPLELVREWRHEAYGNKLTQSEYIAVRAAQWGADQELEACCKWVDKWIEEYADCGDALRDARRHQPPSLKAKALARLALLERLVADLKKAGLVPFHEKDDSIRLALEALPDA